MKKICFILFMILTFNTVYAFDIDIAQIKIGEISNDLTKNLDSTYKIDTEGFDYKIVNDKQATELVRNLVDITLSKKSYADKAKEYTKYMYMSDAVGTETLSGVLFRDTYFNELKKYNITGGYVSNVKTVAFNDDLLAFAYLKEVKVNKVDNEVVLTYWLKKNKGEYKVYYPWITVGTKLEDYFNRLAKEEDKGSVLGSTYNSMSLEGNGSIMVEEEVLYNLFKKNKNKVVQITGVNDAATNMYGSGFFIREGVVVTTWSLLQQFLSNSNYIYVNDANGNAYNVDGIIAAQVDYDVAVLKLNKSVGEPVSFKNSNELRLDDKVFTINSKNNSGFSINYGSFISIDNGRIKNLMAISSSEVGSAIFNKDGMVVGFNVKDQLNSELSFANSTDYLIELQRVLLKQDFNQVKCTSIDDFKNRYYLNYEDEKKYNLIPDKVWDEYKTIGNVEKNIKIDLVKASYTNKIVSLRYRSNSLEAVDFIYVVSNFTNDLRKDGYELVQDNYNKQVYENNKYRVVIRENFNYLVVLLMEK